MSRCLLCHALGDNSHGAETCCVHVVLLCFFFVGVQRGNYRCGFRARRMSKRYLRRLQVNCPALFVRMALRQKHQAQIVSKISAMHAFAMLRFCISWKMLWDWHTYMSESTWAAGLILNDRQMFIICFSMWCRMAHLHCQSLFWCRITSAFVYCWSCYPCIYCCSAGMVCSFFSFI